MKTRTTIEEWAELIDAADPHAPLAATTEELDWLWFNINQRKRTPFPPRETLTILGHPVVEVPDADL
jgi:hypothetical protein